MPSRWIDNFSEKVGFREPSLTCLLVSLTAAGRFDRSHGAG